MACLINPSLHIRLKDMHVYPCPTTNIKKLLGVGNMLRPTVQYFDA
jgi:hypothetical protein